MKSNTIDPTSFPSEHPLAVAMRNVSRHWFLAYSKLMSMEWEWSTAVPYGATDGRRLLLSKSGIDKLCRQPNASGLISFLLVHESLHALLGHGWRLAKMPDSHRANVAADYVINAMIKMRNTELKKEVFPFIDGVLLDEALSGDKSAEQLYRELNKPKEEQPKQEPKPQPKQQDNEPEQDTDETNEGQDKSDTEDESGEDDSKQGDGKCDADGGEDDVSVWQSKGRQGEELQGSEEVDSDDLSDFVGTGATDNLEPEVEDGETQAEAIDKIEEDNDRILIADEIDRRQQADNGTTGQRIGSQRSYGSTLGWPDLLRQWLTSKSRCGWDAPFNAPIYSTTGVVGAGRRNKKAGEIVLVLDTSGSIGQRTYDRFLQEAQAVLDELKPERLHLLSVSHVVADVVTLQEGDAVPHKLKGGGGTEFKPAFDWVRDNVDDMDVMVYLTDGWSCDLQTLPQVEFPLLWLTTQRAVADFKVGEALAITEL
jgi:predicted metal-dependent peptidase